MNLSELANVVSGELRGGNMLFTGVGIDTRSLTTGDLFVALRGPRFDGHQFLPAAEQHGAAGVMVCQPIATNLPAVEVHDTRAALGHLAAHWRNRFEVPVVAVTGSNGKTTVKEMIAAILAVRYPGLVTPGNLNNEIGVPLTLCRLRRRDRYAVIEMGMNHPGEIEYLSRMTQPDVAVITNAAAAHLEGLGSVEAVAAAKAEIYLGLKPDGTAVINLDDAHASLWRQLAGSRIVVGFGTHPSAEVSAAFRPRGEGNSLQLRTPVGTAEIELKLPGQHNVSNALAAAAAALCAGADLEAVCRGLESMTPVPGRLSVRTAACGARVFDDSYNANPASVGAGLEVLARERGEKVLVLGDMAELGADAGAWHEQIGAAAARAGIDRLLTVGDFAAAAAEGFGPGALHCDDKAALSGRLAGLLHKDMTVLVKGSRFMRMEEVVEALCGTAPEGAGLH
jgi:UDP-N-acetylmuramoyl-tripeptide--D-alanyl-D-alanine ligase